MQGGARSTVSISLYVSPNPMNVTGWLNWQENATGADNESLLMAQLSHIWWDCKNYTQGIIYALCAIEPPFLHSLNGHYPYNSIYPHPSWDDSNCSYPSLIRKGTDVCRHSVIYRKFNSVEWMSGEQKKKCKLQKHKLAVISATCIRVVCFLMCHSFSGPNRAR